MIIKWEVVALTEENRDLRNRLKACLELIEDLSNLEQPLFDASVTREFKLKYIRTVARAKKILAKNIKF